MHPFITVINCSEAKKAVVSIDGKETLVRFNDCRKLLLDWEFTDKGTFQIVYHNEYGNGTSHTSRCLAECLSRVCSFDVGLSDLPNGSCAVVQVEALKQGHTQLMAVYKRPGVTLEASVLIAGYPPLKVEISRHQSIVLEGCIS